MRASPPSVGTLVDQSITALKAGDKPGAAALLAQAIQIEPNHEQAWLWLSGIVASDAERRFCLERVRAINPQNAAAQQGLTMLPSVTPRAPSFARDGDKRICTFPGCHEPVTRAGHTLCYQHWKAVNRPPSQPAAPQLLSASMISERLSLQNRSINLMLVELGWLSNEPHGCSITPQGTALGAVQKFNTQTGAAYVLWPESLLTNTVFLATVRSLKGERSAAEPGSALGFRDKFPAQHRTMDGHWVRSKAELLIDNWLYTAGIVHAYERRLPIEKEAYCDFYIPTGRVYIEYWGLEGEPQYMARKKVKRALYKKYSLNLIELSDEHIRNLDDYLPKLLLKFGVIVN